MSNPAKIPSLASSHSGIPDRLLQEAEIVKKKVYSLKTAPDHVPRKSALKLPPDTTREEFDIAIAALGQRLKYDEVQINDGPLKDGWYMEHP